MRTPFALWASLCLASLTLQGAEYRLHRFKKSHLTDQFWSEGAHVGDFNKDGKRDVVSGPFWWEGPDFQKKHEYASATRTFKRKTKDGVEETLPGYAGALSGQNEYSDSFLAFTFDFNADGWDDILIMGWPGKDASWYENPQGKAGHWKRHVAFGEVDNESPDWVDLTGDGRPEILCNHGGYFGYITPDWARPAVPWTFHPISAKGPWQRYTHGVGSGDVNGDGRRDVLDKDGWWEQPPSLAGDPPWKRHEVFFGTGGAQMYAYDVNGDGLNDVITSLAAHGYGLAWFEQFRDQGTIHFRQHTIMNKEPSENKYGVKFSQIHAIDLVDMDADGLKDIVTGKRFWAHGPTGDVEPGAPAVLYWFKLQRGQNHEVEFIPHLIDDDSGIGTQVVARDLNGDAFPEVVVGNKKGTFVHTHLVQNVSREEWEKAQPKPRAVGAGAAGAAGPASAPAAGSAARASGIRPTGRNGEVLNFDDLPFHTSTPVLAEALDPKPRVLADDPPADVVKHAGLSPAEAAQAITLPSGFSAQLFAGEPDVKQPIAFALDGRARLWVAEAYNYPARAPQGKEPDRMLIFEDSNGDGRFEKRTVFIEKLNLVSGLGIGFGGIWVGDAPHLLFIPDRDGDDQPDDELVALQPAGSGAKQASAR